MGFSEGLSASVAFRFFPGLGRRFQHYRETVGIAQIHPLKLIKTLLAKLGHKREKSIHHTQWLLAAKMHFQSIVQFYTPSAPLADIQGYDFYLFT